MAARRPYGTGSIQERGPGRFRLRIHLGSDPLTGRARRRQETFTGTRKMAERRVRELESERDRGVRVAPEGLTVADWLWQWLRAHRAEGHIAETTFERYSRIVQVHLVPAIGQLRLLDLRPEHVSTLKTRWLAGLDGRGPLSNSTVHQHLVVLREAMAEALRAGLVSRNPLDGVRAPSTRRREESRALDGAEIAQLLAAADGTRYQAAISFALATGLREGELLGLSWDDVDLDASTATVRHNLQRLSGKGLVLLEPKTRGSRRTVELSPRTVQLLRDHRVTQLQERLRLGSAFQDLGLVFPADNGAPRDPANFYRGFKRVVARSGIGDARSVTVHTLRHTAATRMVQSGADVLSVSKRLGHSSVSFTLDVYGHLQAGMQAHAAAAMDELIGANLGPTG